MNRQNTDVGTRHGYPSASDLRGANGWWRSTMLRRDSMAPSDSVMSSTTNHTESSPQSVVVTDQSRPSSNVAGWKYRQSADRQSVTTADDLSEVSPPSAAPVYQQPWPIISMNEQPDESFLSFGGLNGSVVPERFLASLYEKSRQTKARNVQRQLVQQQQPDNASHHSAFASLRRQSLPHTIESKNAAKNAHNNLYDNSYEPTNGQLGQLAPLPEVASHTPSPSTPTQPDAFGPLSPAPLKRNNSFTAIQNRPEPSRSACNIATIIDGRSKKRIEDRRKRGMKRAATIGSSDDEPGDAPEDGYSSLNDSNGPTDRDSRQSHAGVLTTQSSFDSGSSKTGKVRYSANQKMRLSRKRSLLLKQKSLPSFLETVEEEGTVSSNEDRLPRVDETASEQSHKSGEQDRLKVQSGNELSSSLSSSQKRQILSNASSNSSMQLNELLSAMTATTATTDGTSARSAYSDCSTSLLSSDVSSMRLPSSSIGSSPFNRPPSSAGWLRNYIEQRTRITPTADLDERPGHVTTVSIEADDGALSPIMCLHANNASSHFSSSYASVESEPEANHVVSLQSEDTCSNRVQLTNKLVVDQCTQTEHVNQTIAQVVEKPVETQGHSNGFVETRYDEWLQTHSCLELSRHTMCAGCHKSLLISLARLPLAMTDSFACHGQHCADAKSVTDPVDTKLAAECEEDLEQNSFQPIQEQEDGFDEFPGDAERQTEPTATTKLGHSNTMPPVTAKMNDATASSRSVSICTGDQTLVQRRLRTMRWLSHRQSHVSSEEREKAALMNICESATEDQASKDDRDGVDAEAEDNCRLQGQAIYSADENERASNTNTNQMHSPDPTPVDRSIGNFFQVVLSSFDDAISAIDNMPDSPQSATCSATQLPLMKEEFYEFTSSAARTSPKCDEEKQQRTSKLSPPTPNTDESSTERIKSQESLLTDIQRLDEKFKQLRDVRCPSPSTEELEHLLSEMTTQHAHEMGVNYDLHGVSSAKVSDGALGGNCQIKTGGPSEVQLSLPCCLSPEVENDYAEIQSARNSPTSSDKTSPRIDARRLYEDSQRIYEEMLRDFQHSSRFAGVALNNNNYSPIKQSAERQYDSRMDWMRIERLVNARIAQVKIEFYNEIAKLQERLGSLQTAGDRSGTTVAGRAVTAELCDEEHHYHTLHSSHSSVHSSDSESERTPSRLLPTTVTSARAGFVSTNTSDTDSTLIASLQAEVGSLRTENLTFRRHLLDATISSLGRTVATVIQHSPDDGESLGDNK